MIFEVMTGVVNSLNGRFPVKTLDVIQLSGKSSIRPPRMLGVARQWTNLYHNHAESKHVRLACDRIGSFENLWRGPCRSVFTGLRYGIHSMNHRSGLEIRQTSVAVAIDENIGLSKGYR